MDDDDDLGSIEPALISNEAAAATRDFRAMPAVVFRRGLLSREERAALAARPRFYSMAWLRPVVHDENPRDDPRAADELVF